MRYEFLCEECGVSSEKDLPLKCYKEAQFCIRCGNKMVRCISTPRFKIKGFNAANGYAHPGKPPGY